MELDILSIDDARAGTETRRWVVVFSVITALIAITSDGAKVADNFRFASRVMEQFRRDGRIDADITFGGERNKSMQINLRNIQEARDTLGPDQMAEQLLRKQQVVGSIPT